MDPQGPDGWTQTETSLVCAQGSPPRQGLLCSYGAPCAKGVTLVSNSPSSPASHTVQQSVCSLPGGPGLAPIGIGRTTSPRRSCTDSGVPAWGASCRFPVLLQERRAPWVNTSPGAAATSCPRSSRNMGRCRFFPRPWPGLLNSGGRLCNYNFHLTAPTTCDMKMHLKQPVLPPTTI